METQDYISIEIPGHPFQDVQTNNLPPVGTRFMVHKHLTDGRVSMNLEVTLHEWRLEEPQEENGNAFFSITVHTRLID